MTARIICGFPGVGKTRLAQAPSNRFVDVDFPSDGYRSDEHRIFDHVSAIEAILNNSNGIALVPDWPALLDALTERGLHYALVYPHEELKGTYLRRYVRRFNRGNFVGDMALHWGERIAACRARTDCEHYVLKYHDQYLSSIIDLIVD